MLIWASLRPPGQRPKENQLRCRWGSHDIWHNAFSYWTAMAGKGTFDGALRGLSWWWNSQIFPTASLHIHHALHHYNIQYPYPRGRRTNPQNSHCPNRELSDVGGNTWRGILGGSRFLEKSTWCCVSFWKHLVKGLQQRLSLVGNRIGPKDNPEKTALHRTSLASQPTALFTRPRCSSLRGPEEQCQNLNCLAFKMYINSQRKCHCLCSRSPPAGFVQCSQAFTNTGSYLLQDLCSLSLRCWWYEFSHEFSISLAFSGRQHHLVMKPEAWKPWEVECMCCFCHEPTL